MSKKQHGWASLVAIAAPAVAIALAAYWIPWPSVAGANPAVPAIFLFLALAPLVNALFDCVSYAVTLAFAERGRRGFPMVWGLLDAVVAFCLFVALGTALVCIVALMARVSGHAFVDLGGLLAQAGDLSRYWWLYLMLFSTALPTALHLALAGLSLQTCWSLGRRETLCQLIEDAAHGDLRASIVAPFSVGVLWLAGITIVFAVAGGIGWLFWHFGLGAFFDLYRDWLISVSVRIGGI